MGNGNLTARGNGGSPTPVDVDIALGLRRDGHVRATVPGGWLHVERPLPFLCVHRRDPRAHPGTERLVRGQAAHLVVTADPGAQGAVAALVEEVVTGVEEIGDFGAYLVLEVWIGAPGAPVRVFAPPEGSSTATALVGALGRAVTGEDPQCVDDAAPAPPHLEPLLGAETIRSLGVLLLGLEVPPVFVDADGSTLPGVFDRLQDDLTLALRQSAYEFATVQTTLEAEHVGELGRRRLIEPIPEVDRRLADLAVLADPLLAVTPVDVDVAWEQFHADRFERAPHFHYRPLTVDPDLVKRSLYELPIEAVEDPTLAGLFRDKRHELDAQLDLLLRRDTPAFLPSSLTLYGRPDGSLVDLARRVVSAVAELAPDGATRSPRRVVEAPAFATEARTELRRLQERAPEVVLDVDIRDDVTGLMVDNGRLLVGAGLRVDSARVDALVQHEVGTHVLTWVNGGRQPLEILRVGLPHYDETQEALAVVAEFAVGGLTPGRLATLAGRVLAAGCLVDGASFVETFRFLRTESGFGPERAFEVTARTHRAGGLTKDLVYLRGLQRLLDHLGRSGSMDLLLVGKVSLDYLPVVEELRTRRVLVPPALQPRWLAWPGSEARLQALQTGLDVEDLIDGRRQ